MMSDSKKKAVALLSGGMDSSVVLAEAIHQGFDVHALTFQYGQRHRVEIMAAQKQAAQLGAARHVVFDLNLGQFGGSALTANIEVPKNADSADIPVTYVPARNTVFLSVALSYAEAIGARDIFIGVSSVDYSGYPDCRPQFIGAFEAVANLGTKAAEGGPQFKIHAPLLHLTKEQTVRMGRRLGVQFQDTHTCYDPDSAGRACGSCDACILREKGFTEAGMNDPAREKGQV